MSDTATEPETERDLTGHYDGEPVGQLHPDDAERLRAMSLPAVSEPSEMPVQFPAAQQRVTLLRTYVDLAARLCGTEFVPKGLRGKPAAVLACMLTGQEMGIGPMQALTHIHVVDGRPTQSAELMRAQILRAGHRFSIREKSNTKVTVYGQRSDTGEELAITWTMEDAKTAGLIKDGSAWKHYPRAMLMARATSELARDLFADVLGGVSYTPEELGAEVVVTDGGYIDVTATEGSVGAEDIPDGPLDPTAAWDRVNAMKAREVVEELKRLNLPPGGKEADLRARLAEAYTAASPEPDAAQEPDTTPQVAPDAPAAPEATDTADGPESATEAHVAPDAPKPRASSRAKAVKQAVAVVEEMTDEAIVDAILAAGIEPDDDPAERRAQLIRLLADDEPTAAAPATLPGVES